MKVGIIEHEPPHPDPWRNCGSSATIQRATPPRLNHLGSLYSFLSRKNRDRAASVAIKSAKYCDNFRYYIDTSSCECYIYDTPTGWSGRVQNKWPGRCCKHLPGRTMRKLGLPMIASQNTVVSVCPQSTSSSTDAHQIIQKYAPMVPKIAKIAFGRYRRAFEQDDLEGCGYLGLVKAANKFMALAPQVRQGIDLDFYIEKRIWRGIESGRDGIAIIHRYHYQLIQRGQMAQPKFLHDSEDFCLADAISTEAEPSLKHNIEEPVGLMLDWLRKQNPAWARAVEMRVHQNMTFVQLGKAINRTPSGAASLYFRALNLLRWKYNPAKYKADDHARRQRKAS